MPNVVFCNIQLASFFFSLRFYRGRMFTLCIILQKGGKKRNREGVILVCFSYEQRGSRASTSEREATEELLNTRGDNKNENKATDLKETLLERWFRHESRVRNGP